MARFANECLASCRRVFIEAAAAGLGEDTSGLKIRIGLHSGSVEGGILQGDKKRFQLYGDTVNVASRMETTGVPGMIHASKATADELRCHGFETWVNLRREKVAPKGVGLVETYWIQVVA